MSTIPEPTQSLSYAELTRTLPPPYADDTLAAQIRDELARSGRKVVVLDDDPTGPQAIRDVYVLTEWSVDALRRELLEPRPLFFVLANTRALPEAQAVALHQTIAANLRAAREQSGVSYTLISRADSTLRGHYPAEVDALGTFDATILVPFFAEGGRFTYNDVQLVREGDLLVPAAQTAYARDLMFGYAHSNLRNWVEEKSRGRIRADEVQSISLELLRRGDVAQVTARLRDAQGATMIVNALDYRDLEVFTLGLLRAEAHGCTFVVRSAASFVRVRGGGGDPLAPRTWTRVDGAAGGLIIVGSHVPKSSAQLARLLDGGGFAQTELRVPELIAGNGAAEVERVSAFTHAALSAGRDTVVYSTRQVVAPAGEGSLDIGRSITAAWVAIVRRLQVRPRFLVTKGGWTASEIGTRALAVKRAYVPAPILPGVPMWVLGEESRFRGLPYVIFPGNVGDEDALRDVVAKLADPAR